VTSIADLYCALLALQSASLTDALEKARVEGYFEPTLTEMRAAVKVELADAVVVIGQHSVDRRDRLALEADTQRRLVEARLDKAAHE